MVPKVRPLLALAAIVIVPALVLSSTFSYRYTRISVTTTPPVVWFEDPDATGVKTHLYWGKTAAEVRLDPYPVAGIERIRRSAIYFDTFDSNPLPGRITTLTCGWNYDATAKAISASVSQRGSASWGFSCIAIVNLDVSSYVRSGRRVYVAFLTWRSSFSGVTTLYDAAYYVDQSTYRIYEVGYEVGLRTGRTGDYVYSSIRHYSGTTWSSLASVSLGISLTLEYNYLSQVASMADFGAWRLEHWNVTMLSSTSVGAGQRFYPSRIGIGFWVDRTGSGTIYYDNLVVTIDGLPWLVNVTGLPDGWTAVLRSSTGREVSRATSSGGTAALAIWAPRVDLASVPDNRDGFVFPSASIEVYDPSGSLVARRTFDYVVGGDVYRLSLSYIYVGPLLHVYSNTSAFWARLTALRLSCSPRVNISLGLETWDGWVTNASVTVINGILEAGETSEIYVKPPAQWGSSWLALAARVNATLPPSSACELEVVFEWWVSEGVKALLPVKLVLRTSA